MKSQWTVFLALVVLPTLVSRGGELAYAVIDLGTLGGPNSFAYAINNSGQVVGESDTADGVSHAFLYSDGSMTDLGTLGGKCSSAYGINDASQVVGQADGADGGQHAFLFDSGTMNVLGPANTYTVAYGINAAGQVAGVIATDDNLHAALFDHGTTVDLDQNSGRSWGFAKAINSSGQIGGIGAVGDEPIRAAVFNHGTITYPSAPAPYTTFINAINDQGISAGQSMGHAALFDGTGQVIDMDTLAGIPNFPYLSEAFGINNHGEVVGTSDTLNQGQHAFLYEGGTMFDLNALITSAPGWTLAHASAINDAGQIVGDGLFEGQSTAFLLTPTASSAVGQAPEPATACLVLLGGTLLLARRRRKA